ncbi:hypothetical protein TrCOL_g10104 [Triparma columacea]|nr:hypothetical protein TrCOL_g10104 [Triparma columacea]
MRVHQLSQALCYKRIERGGQEGRIRDKWGEVKGRIKRMKKEVGERYEARLKGLKEGSEKENFEKLREAQIKAGGDYERLVKEHMIKVMSSRPSVGWGKREELEGQMVGNMEGQWKTFGTQLDEMSKRYEDAKRQEEGKGGKKGDDGIGDSLFGAGEQVMGAEEVAAEIQKQMKTYWSKQERAIDDMEIGTEQEFKNHNDLPLARIKRIMKSDEDVRMISAEAPVLFAKACELFILELTLSSWCHSQGQKRRTVQREDIQNAVKNTEVLDFLVDVITTDGMALDDGPPGREELEGMMGLMGSPPGGVARVVSQSYGGMGMMEEDDDDEGEYDDDEKMRTPVKAEGKGDGEGEWFVGSGGERTRVKTEAKPGGSI